MYLYLAEKYIEIIAVFTLLEAMFRRWIEIGFAVDSF